MKLSVEELLGSKRQVIRLVDWESDEYAEEPFWATIDYNIHSSTYYYHDADCNISSKSSEVIVEFFNSRQSVFNKINRYSNE